MHICKPQEHSLNQLYNIDRRQVNGFTLIELLACIAVVATLASILIVVTQNAISRARQTKCVSQVRQLGSAWSIYFTDHGGRLPSNGRDSGNLNPSAWKVGENLVQFGELFQYFNISEDIEVTPDVLICPEVDQAVEENFKSASSGGTKICSYWMNPEASTNPTNSKVIAQMPPDRVIVSCGVTWWNLNAFNREPNHHGEGIALVYVNGSAVWLPIDKIKDVPAWNWNELAKVH
ncbi:type II secretion system protein [Cerasicoccus maritimus]|uniref:type II secretion system protein n=1 Tax=Cerasicoccus maritimus TaxID=490089 RepID=UPI002852A85F|nr:type II secretion system protein [Cerasicoccus maritimus]